MALHREPNKVMGQQQTTQVAAWKSMTVTVPANTKQLTFRGVTGAGWASDIAIDDITLRQQATEDNCFQTIYIIWATPQPIYCLHPCVLYCLFLVIIYWIRGVPPPPHWEASINIRQSIEISGNVFPTYPSIQV